MAKKVEEAHPDSSGLGTGSVQQLALAEALRKVVPFTAGEKEYRENLKHVWFEAQGGTLELTAADGYRIAHATLEAGCNPRPVRPANWGHPHVDGDQVKGANDDPKWERTSSKRTAKPPWRRPWAAP